MKRSLFSWLVGLVFALLVAGSATPAFAASPATPLLVHVSVKNCRPLNSLSQIRGNLVSVWVGGTHYQASLGCRCVSCLGLTGSYNLPL